MGLPRSSIHAQLHMQIDYEIKTKMDSVKKYKKLLGHLLISVCVT